MVTVEISESRALSEAFKQSLIELRHGERILTCLQCGTCTAVCPLGPWLQFTPRKILAATNAYEFDEVMQTDTAWLCVSCYACAHMCPAQIPLAAAVMTRTKEELLLAGEVPAELQLALENSQRYGNPMGESPRKRADWVSGIEPSVTILGQARKPVEVLWFVGDYASYHPRAQQATIALAKVFNALGVDFGILGPEEYSDGDSQRLAGERGLFELLAEKNARSFAKYDFGLIVTGDPHAYNALKNEYPELGIDYPVKHYTQFLAEKIDQLQGLLCTEIEAVVVYHDPCYLGRANEIYEEPRTLLEAIPGVTLAEMSHSRSFSLCCGGGGGGMWLDGFSWEKTGIRLSEWRVREAVAAQPDGQFVSLIGPKPTPKPRSTPIEYPARRILAVACPYEAPRFEDATKVVQGAEGLIVKDIAELLVQAMKGKE